MGIPTTSHEATVFISNPKYLDKADASPTATKAPIKGKVAEALGG